MTLSSAFEEAFKELMQKHKFVFKQNTFFRIRGENIVQALCVKEVYPTYCFCINIVPVAFVRSQPMGVFFEHRLREMTWAEYLTLSFDGYRDFPHTNGCRPVPHISGQTDAQTAANMAKAAELFEAKYLPWFEKVSDFHSYFDWITNPKTKEGASGCFRLSGTELMYKAYLDESSEYGTKYLFNVLKEDFVSSLKLGFGDWNSESFCDNYGAVANKAEAVSPVVLQKRLRNVSDAIEKNNEKWTTRKYFSFLSCAAVNRFDSVKCTVMREEDEVLPVFAMVFPGAFDYLKYGVQAV